MKDDEAKNLKPGITVKHERYGLCEVREVLRCGTDLFGVVVRPTTTAGKANLRGDCGCDVPDTLEDDARRLSS